MGLVIFLFTDIVGSMRHWAADPDRMRAALEQHDALLHAAFDAHDGEVFSIGGDGFGVVFEAADDAAASARQIVATIDAHSWPDGEPLEVRIGMHAGTAQRRQDNWFGQSVNIAARVCDAAHGGQILLTEDTVEVLDPVRASSGLVDLGYFELRGVGHKLGLHQIGYREFPPPRAIDPTRDTLPEPAHALVGRNEELGEIRALVDAHRLVTMSGVGGMGKTRLAVEIAHRMAPSFADGVYFADLRAADSEDAMYGQIAAAIRLELLAGDLAEQAVEQVADARALLVLDNCEHLLAETGAFASAVLRRGGPGRLLATTRERLGVAGEQQYRLQPLSEGSTGVEDCAQLFVDRALSIEPGFEVDDGAALAELLTRLEGLPLAIELAAARTSILSVSEILDRIDDRLTLLSPRRAPQDRTLRAMLEWSWQLLDDDERRMLAAASVFDGSFDAELLGATVGTDPIDTLDLLESLVDKSLISIHGRIGARTRYRMLESVRAYAHEQLVASGSFDEARSAMAAALFARVDTGAEPFVAAARDHNDVLAEDAANLLAAHSHAIDRGDDDLAMQLAAHGAGMLLDVGRPHDAVAILRTCVERDTGSPHLLARCQVGLGLAAMQSDDFAAAHDAIVGLTNSDDPFIEAGANGLLAVPALFERSDDVDRLVLASLEASKRSPTAGVLPQVIDGFRHFARLDHAGAAAAMAPSLQRTPGPQAMLQVMLNCGWSAASIMAGDLDGAEQILDLQPGTSVWDTSAMLRGILLARRGDFLAAEAQLREVSEHALLGRQRRAANDALVGWAGLRAAMGDPRAASVLLDALLPRNVHTLAVAAQLALEIGELDAFLTRSAEVRAAEGDGRTEATEALRAELAR